MLAQQTKTWIHLVETALYSHIYQVIATSSSILALCCTHLLHQSKCNNNPRKGRWASNVE